MTIRTIFHAKQPFPTISNNNNNNNTKPRRTRSLVFADSPVRDLVSSAILRLQEDSVLHMIKDHWWKQKAPAACSGAEEKNKQEANELDLSTLGGVFVLLVGGLGLAVVIGLVEFVWKARQFADNDQRPLCIELADQLKFAVKCRRTQDKRPPLRKRPSVEKFLD
ncbi:PREDICTED: glutamate receptor ionotropic, kainate 2-like, partial [Priapulus caudatus]|uniref:Glutamate receptor ionotropic, kainate 2-like n=1 Tax=Priapulus caudatus TaxID=37621 RepID=A0ABM1F560_PRICU